MDNVEAPKLMCKCGSNPAAEPHACPFKLELNDDHSLCACCEECTQECVGQI